MERETVDSIAGALERALALFGGAQPSSEEIAERFGGGKAGRREFAMEIARARGIKLKSAQKALSRARKPGTRDYRSGMKGLRGKSAARYGKNDQAGLRDTIKMINGSSRIRADGGRTDVLITMTVVITSSDGDKDERERASVSISNVATQGAIDALGKNDREGAAEALEAALLRAWGINAGSGEVHITAIAHLEFQRAGTARRRRAA